jgi:hypothetical protein
VWKQPSDEPDTYALLVQAVARLARDGRRLCVVLDRFEEFVILLEPEARAGFAALLRQLAEEPVSGLRLVLVLRTEYEHLLADAGLPRLRQGENWFKLGAFTEPAAREFLQASGLDLAPETFDRLLKGAARWRRRAASTARSSSTSWADPRPPALRLPEFDPERVIQTHLSESVGASDVRDDATAILPRMITEAGTKRPVEEAALAAETRVPLARVRHFLLRLAEGGLVRPLGRKQLVWEIGHDFIATQLALLIGRLRVPLWRRALPNAVPALGTLGVGTALLLGSWWPQRQIEGAIAALSAQGFTISGDRTTGFHINSQELEKGAIEVMGPHLRVLQPATLVISGDLRSTSFPPLEGLVGLRRLVVFRNPSLRALPSMEGLAGLEMLEVVGNGRLQTLPPLEGLTRLNWLEVRNNATLRTLPPLGGLTELRTLVVGGNPELPRLPSLEILPLLQAVTLEGPFVEATLRD